MSMFALALTFGCQGESPSKATNGDTSSGASESTSENDVDGVAESGPSTSADPTATESGPAESGATEPGGSESTASTGSSSSSSSISGGDQTDSSSSTSGASDPGDDAVVCARWNDDRADLSEGSWSGDAESCDPGDISADGRANALKIVNLYRWLAELPPVETSDHSDDLAQACSLLLHANKALSHSPPATWQCYSAAGATGAKSSNISTARGVKAVDLYMADPGNATTLGHRRWILSNSLGPIGLGSTDDYSCMRVGGGQGDVGAPWTAWPSPGPFPHEAMLASWKPVDETGWSVQSDTINLSGATVELSTEGQSLPVTVTTLAGGYGSKSAISIIPQGWASQPGTTYRVHITGISDPISYEVHMLEC